MQGLWGRSMPRYQKGEVMAGALEVEGQMVELGSKLGIGSENKALLTDAPELK